MTQGGTEVAVVVEVAGEPRHAVQPFGLELGPHGASLRVGGRLVAHLVIQVDGGLRHIGVWNSEEDWQHFHDERVEPAVHAVLTAAGFTEMPPDPPVQALQLIDVRLGA